MLQQNMSKITHSHCVKYDAFCLVVCVGVCLRLTARSVDLDGLVGAQSV